MISAQPGINLAADRGQRTYQAHHSQPDADELKKVKRRWTITKGIVLQTYLYMPYTIHIIIAPATGYIYIYIYNL
uniref:Uncharacterized protein n=1 Tax=Heterorhabditis bacteriophora TaxID=37862 RepID=A0A1I7WFG8_HETBA